MQKQVIVNRVNLIPEGSVVTITNDGKEILKRNACGVFHEEIFSSNTNQNIILFEFIESVNQLKDFWNFQSNDMVNLEIDKESFLELLEDYFAHNFSAELMPVIETDPDDTHYNFIYYNL